MKFIEDNAGMLPGESCIIPVCSVCGCKKLYKQETGVMKKLKLCPLCGHILNWKKEGKKQ